MYVHANKGHANPLIVVLNNDNDDDNNNNACKAMVCMALHASGVQTNTLAMALSTTLYIARWRELRCNRSKNPLVYAGMVRGLMVLLLYPGGVAGMLLGTSRWLIRLLHHMLETLQSGRALRQSERRRRKLRSTMNCAAITFSSRWLARWLVFGILRRKNFSMIEASAFHVLLARLVKPVFCIRGCLSHCRRGMLHAFIDRTLILTGWSDAIWFLLLPKPHYLMLPGMKYWGLKKK